MKFRIQQPPKFTVAAIDTRIFDNEDINRIESHLIDPTDNKIHLCAAGGERIYFQLIIHQAKQESINIKFSSLIPSASADSQNSEKQFPVKWRVYKIRNISVKGYDAFCSRLSENEILTPTEFPDPLIEIKTNTNKNNSFSTDIDTQRLALFLIELDIPKIKKAENYTGKIIVSDNMASVSKEFVLHTFGFNLPQSDINIFALIDGTRIWQHYRIGILRNPHKLILPLDSFQINQFADITSSLTKAIEENGLQCLLANVYPRISQNDINWASYRTLIQKFLSQNEKSRKYWLAPISLYFPSSRHFGPPSSDIYQQIINKLLTEFNEQFIKKAALGKGIIALTWPDSYPKAHTEYQRYCNVIKAIFKSEQPFDIINPFITVNFKPFGWDSFEPFTDIDKYINIYCPLELWLDTDSIEKFHKTGKSVLWRPDNYWGTFPGAKITYPPYLIRSLGWICKRYNTDGVLLGTINDWSEANKDNSETNLTNSARILIYPGDWFGQEFPVESLRLKLLSRSLQDVAYLVKLKEIGETKLANWLTRNLIRYAHTDALDGSLWNLRNDGICNNIRAWHLAKLIAGYTILQNSLSEDKRKQFSLGNREKNADYLKMLKTQFRQATESVIIDIDGVKIRNVFNEITGNNDTKLSYYFTIRNFSDKAIKPEIKFVEKPESYKAIRNKITLDKLSWSWPIEDKIECITSALAFSVFGVSYQPIAFKIDNNTKKYIPARSCALSAGKIEFPVIIDGDLTDWPDIPIAGDFQRIKSDNLNATTLQNQSQPAIWKTQVKIGYDKDYLYFAFICNEPAEALRMRYSNTISVSNGFSWGEDLIEIYIDPDNTGTLDPMNVYHIILKANGTVIAFKGPSEAYRQGACKLWPTQISAAIKIYKDFWQAELRIPFNAFKKTDANNKWWGMDFTRTSSAIGEISSWSGTKGQFGRPVSLGNIFIDR